ncbi:MAG: hypothetical protein ACLRTD_24475 [Bacteroides sp.]
MLYNEAVKNENPNASLPYSDEDIELFRNGSDHRTIRIGIRKHSKFFFEQHNSQSMVDLKDKLQCICRLLYQVV